MTKKRIRDRVREVHERYAPSLSRFGTRPDFEPGFKMLNGEVVADGEEHERIDYIAAEQLYEALWSKVGTEIARPSLKYRVVLDPDVHLGVRHWTSPTRFGTHWEWEYGALRDDLMSWLDENTEGKVHIVWGKDLRATFEMVEDAVLFRLRWC